MKENEPKPYLRQFSYLFFFWEIQVEFDEGITFSLIRSVVGIYYLF